MAQVARMDGALLAHTGSHYYLVGSFERPCDFRAHGFEAPDQAVDAQARPYIELKRLHAAVKLEAPNILGGRSIRRATQEGREGTDVTLSQSPDQFAAFLNEDAKFWVKLVKDAGVKLE